GRGPPGDGRRPRPADPPVPDRRRALGPLRRRAGRPRWLLGLPGSPALSPEPDLAPRERPLRLADPPLHGRREPGDGAPLRPGPGPPCRPAGPRGRLEDRAAGRQAGPGPV